MQYISKRKLRWIWILISAWVFLVGGTICAFACEVSQIKHSQHSCCPDKDSSAKNTTSQKCCKAEQYILHKALSFNGEIGKELYVLNVLISVNFISGISNIPERITLEPQEIPKLHSKNSLTISHKKLLI